MVNILAQGGIDSMDEVESVRILVGGLPQDPEPPLNYQIVYSMEGVLDYYTTSVLVLEDGEVVEKEALTDLEEVSFPEPLGTLEPPSSPPPSHPVRQRRRAGRTTGAAETRP